MKNFSLKFLDIMVGLVLGLGFQWWPELHEPWQYIAFIYAYIDIVDYWIDYGPSLRKFPPKREIDVFLDVGIMFSLFLYIYAAQKTPIYFFAAHIILCILDYFWLYSSDLEYKPTGIDGKFVHTWMRFNLIEAFVTLLFIAAAYSTSVSSLYLILGFVAFRLLTRVMASLEYKKVHFV